MGDALWGDSLHCGDGGSIRPGLALCQALDPPGEVTRRGDDIAFANIGRHVADGCILPDAVLPDVPRDERGRYSLVGPEHGHRRGGQAVGYDEVLDDELVVSEAGYPLDDRCQDRIAGVRVLPICTWCKVAEIARRIHADHLAGRELIGGVDRLLVLDVVLPCVRHGARRGHIVVRHVEDPRGV